MTDTGKQIPAAAIAALAKGNKIEAIKIVREASGIGLKEAKDAVEAYVTTDPALAVSMQESSAAAQRGFLKWVVLLVLAAAAYYFLRIR